MERLIEALTTARPATTKPYLIGITGSVAAGKSTLANAVAGSLGRSQILTTDCFLRPNADLDAAGLTMQKGFPDTFDVAALRHAVTELRRGVSVSVPRYSHVVYDISAGEYDTVQPDEVVILDGLHLWSFAGDLLDTVVYLDASEAALERWYVGRFLELVAQARLDDSGFYRLFASLDDETVVATAQHLWRSINLVNLRSHIAPERDHADVVVHLGDDHEMVTIEVRSQVRSQVRSGFRTT